MKAKKQNATSPAAPATAPAATPATASPAATPPPQPQSATPPPAPPAGSLITTTANGGNHGTKVDLQAIYQAVISGLLTFYLPTDIFQMLAGTFTRDELIEEFQGFVTAAQATKTSNAQWRSDIQAERALEQHVRVLRQGVKGIVTARFGANGAQILQFGYTMPKPRTKSATTKAIAVAKSKATRKERNTLGKVQKKDIKGNVDVAVVVTPAGNAGQGGAQASASNGAQGSAPSGSNGAQPTGAATPPAQNGSTTHAANGGGSPPPQPTGPTS